MSEEELLQFIAQVETNEMIEAPFYLKENILSEAKEWQRKSVRRQYRAFQLKVCLATAAAVAVIFLIPFELRMTDLTNKTESMTKEEYMEKQNRSFSDSVDHFVEKIMGQISFKEDIKYEKSEKK